MTTAIATPPAASSAASAPPTTSITGVANGSNHSTKIDLQVAYQALTTGLATFYQPTDTFILPSGTVTRDALIAQFQGFINVAETTKSAQQGWHEAVQAERAAEVVVRPVRQAVRSIVTGRFGASAAQLAQFGFVPLKPAVRKVEVKAQALVKMKATRVARSTKGKVQKKAIKGTAPAVGSDVTSLPAQPSTGTAPATQPAQTPATQPGQTPVVKAAS
jgi:hypothetical protein